MVRRLSAELHQLHPQRTIEWRIANDLPVVLADEALLAQALRQVLDNAVKFTAKRPLAAIDVRAHCAEADGFTVLEVRDNGVGFNLALQSKLFQAFGRLHSATEFAGLGMGLALARKLVERLGGTITAQSEAGAGCCVRLQLPDFTQ
jgi:signal transduction histidine kinase